jgi:hypothetical protein
MRMFTMKVISQAFESIKNGMGLLDGFVSKGSLKCPSASDSAG